MRWERPAGHGLFALSGVVLAAVGLILAFAPPGWSIGRLAGDDAGYYFTIARNYCLGYGFSFDRLHATNGFNPLFPWILIPAFQLLPADLPLVACYRIGVLAGFGATVAALAVFLRVLAASLEPRVFSGNLRHLALAAGAAFFALFVATKAYYGMDAPLVLLLGLLYVRRVASGGPLAPGAGAALSDGLVLGLAFLARVDTLPLLAAAFAVMGCEWLARRRGGRALAARLAVTLLVCMPYLVWSTMRFGTWLPVSARLKSTFPRLDPAGSLWVIRNTSLNHVDQASFLVALVLACGMATVLVRHVLAARRARAAIDPVVAALGTLALYLIGRLGYMLVFSRADVQGSYAILAHVFNVLVLARATGHLALRSANARPGAGRRLAACAAAGLGLVAVLLVAAKARTTLARWNASEAGGMTDEARLGREIHDLTRPGDVLYGGTFGMLGFFSDRAWINLDGVVNTYAYQRVFLEPGSHGEGGLAGYLRSNRVTHVVVTIPRDFQPGPGPMRLTAYSILYDRVNGFDVSPADIVLKRPSPRGPVEGAYLYVVRFRP